MNIQNRFFFLFLFRFFLLYFLLIAKRQVRHIYKLNIWHLSAGKHITDIDVTQSRDSRHLSHGIKSLLHTILTDCHIRSYMNQFAGFACRTSAHCTELVKIIGFFMLLCVIVCHYLTGLYRSLGCLVFLRYSLVFFVCIYFSVIVIYHKNFSIRLYFPQKCR